MIPGAQIYTTWKMKCERCKGHFNFTCWEKDMPVRCACTGNLTRDMPVYKPRQIATLESTILSDLASVGVVNAD